MIIFQFRHCNFDNFFSSANLEDLLHNTTLSVKHDSLCISFVCLINNGLPSFTQGMFDWVDILENKLDSMSPVGTDLETVKQQIVELKVQFFLFQNR